MKTVLQRIKRAGVLSINDALVLDELANYGASINGLVDRTRICASTVDASLRRLVSLGLVTRAYVCPSHQYKITPTGRSIFTL